MLYVFFLFVFVLILRLFYLQVNQGSRFSDLGKKNFLRMEVISPPRGNLTDCNGVLIASNRPVFDLYWDGLGNNNFSEKQIGMISKLSRILNIDFEQDEKIKNIKFAEKTFKRFLIKQDISFDELCQISEQCSEFYNLVITNRFKRIYPYNNLAAHILGYLSKQEQDYTTIGLCGVEKAFQKELKGEVGYVVNIINSKGRKLEQKDLKDPRAGSDIKLTLDWRLQSIAESLFEQDQSGVFVLMDPTDGAVKVFLSYPTFDPNCFLESISKQDWDEKFSYNKPLLNRITSAGYPPASIFKLVTLAAGLEEGIIEPDTMFDCRGYKEFCSRKYHCIRKTGHGAISARMALSYSCNIPCFEIALKMKVDQLANYAFKFGLGQPTGFLLPEFPGLVPTYEWKVAVKNEPWWKGETLSAAIGQSYTLVTPLQMVRMIASIYSGYLVKPRILEREKIEKEDLKISRRTLSFLREGMRGAVEFGSAKLLGRIKNFEIYAKTGTAQTSSLATEKLFKRQFEHGWLAVYFSYKGQKPLALVVLVENAQTTQPSKEIVAKFLLAYAKLKETEDNKEKENLEVEA